MSSLWRTPGAVYQFGLLNKWHGYFGPRAVRDAQEGAERALKASDLGHHCLFACAQFKSPGSRKFENATGAWGLWMDIDCGPEKSAKGKGYETKEEALDAMRAFCSQSGLQEPSLIIDSGGGYHVYWVLDAFLDVEMWKDVASKLKAVAAALGFRADPSRTADITSLLRVPGTYNTKYTPRRPVTFVKRSTHLSASEVCQAIERAHERWCGGPSPDPEVSLDRPLPSIEEVRQTLGRIDPGCGRDRWIRALMAVHAVTKGSEDGLSLVIDWSSKGANFKNAADVEACWRSFRHDVARPLGMGSLVTMAKEEEETFKVEEMVVVEAKQAAPVQAKGRPLVPHLLSKFSLRGEGLAMAAALPEKKPILGGLAYQGQGTVIYADPNVGKTLMTLHLLFQDIEQGLVTPENLYYVNADDDRFGLAEKVVLSDVHGLHMLSEGHNGFSAKQLKGLMEDMISSGSAEGTILVLDTLKKFANLMDKGQGQSFTERVRRFTLAGGTVIGLAHNNKHSTQSGKRIYSGTSDMVDDLDCAMYLNVVDEKNAEGRRMVAFSNMKRRGSSAMGSAFSYVHDGDLSYLERLNSVRSEGTISGKKVPDEKVADAIRAMIEGGIQQKSVLLKAAGESVGVSRAKVLAVLDRHVDRYWSYDVGPHNTHTYRLIAAAD